MARPKKDPAELRAHRMGVMLTLEEWTTIEQTAHRLGLSVSEYVRRRSLSYRMPAASAAGNNQAELATALLRLGVNLNQITKHMNAGRSMPDHLPDLIAEIDRHVERLSE